MKLADSSDGEPKNVVRKSGAAICIADERDRGQIMAALAHMKIVPAVFERGSRVDKTLNRVEFIVADELVARDLVASFDDEARDDDGTVPAIIAVIRQDAELMAVVPDSDCNFDGILRLPMTSGDISAHCRL